MWANTSVARAHEHCACACTVASQARVEGVTGGRQADTRNCFGQLQYKEPRTGAWMTVETYQQRYMRDVLRTREVVDANLSVGKAPTSVPSTLLKPVSVPSD